MHVCVIGTGLKLKVRLWSVFYHCSQDSSTARLVVFPISYTCTYVFSLSVSRRIAFAKPGDLETWPYHLILGFLATVSKFLCAQIVLWIQLKTFLLVRWYDERASLTFEPIVSLLSFHMGCRFDWAAAVCAHVTWMVYQSLVDKTPHFHLVIWFLPCI